MPASRPLTHDDLPACLALCRSAGWNQLDADWRALLAAEPLGCIGIETGGAIVSTATAIVNPAGVSWIGMVLTHPDHRGHGYATQLLKESITHLEERGVATMKLDATHLGEPLYRKLGFIDEAPIERWRRDPGPCASIPPTGNYAGPLHHAAIPIEAIAQSTTAWAACRDGANARYFGPCYADSPESAEAVARALIAPHPDRPFFWDLFPQHAAAEVAARLGFTPVRKLLRMVRGQPAATPPETFAIAGFEWG
jgi:GNAT superfamily N-acetyltransferase